MPCMRIFLSIFVVIFCLSCAKNYEAPNFENFSEQKFSLNCDGKKYFLIINNELNFALFDAFFAPIVSKKFENSRFKNTKFLPPNSKFDEIFIEILKMIKNGENEKFIETKKNSCWVKKL